MKVNPAHIIQFAMIVEKGSFAQAADTLNLSQPALSRNMKILEERLGASLMRRDRNGVFPTDLGRTLYGYGQTMREAFGHATDLAISLQSADVGLLRIGATPHMLDSLLSEFLSSFINEFPNLRFHLASGVVRDLIEQLLSGDLDLVLCPLETVQRNELIIFENLFEDRVEIVCGASHPLAKRERVNADDLIGCRWISHPDGSLIGQQMELTLLQLGVSSVNSVVETGSKQVVADLLRATDLVSVLPPVYFKEEFVSGDLTILKTGQTLLHRPLGLAYHAKIASIPAVLMLRRHISEWAAALK